MGIFDKIIDFGERALGLPTADDRRKQQAMMNEQIKAYREQSEISRQELSKAKDAEAIEQRRIQEKQIRSLRRSYRPAGILGQGAPADNDMNQKLGG